MERKKRMQFDKAVSFLTPRIAGQLQALGEDVKGRIQEVRLRAGKPLLLTAGKESLFLLPNGRVSGIYSDTAILVSAAEINDSFTRLCAYSVHSHRESIRNGFITVEGGHRAGICGTAVSEAGAVSAVREISSINLRIAGEYPGVADAIYQKLYAKGLCSIIIAGPPSSGKTTMLRDLARQLSGQVHRHFYRVAVADERGELAAVYRCEAQNDLGMNCDVLHAYPKGEAIQTAVRTLSPQLVICDEVGTLQEIEAIEAGVNSGVCFAVSAHAGSYEDLCRRPQLRRLLLSAAFDYVVLLDGGAAPCRIQEIYSTEALCDAISRSTDAGHMLFSVGAVPSQQNIRPRQGA